MQEIEQIVTKAIRSFRQRFLERAEVGVALGVGNCNLSIQERRTAWQSRKRRYQTLEFFGPVETVPRADRDAIPRDRSDGAIAVEFDLVQPIVAGRRCVDERRELRLNEGRKLQRREL
jgi:hypothetical protein